MKEIKVYKDIRKCKSKIINSIRKFGFSPEHNYYHYLYKQTPHKRCIFLDFGQKKGVMAMLNRKNSVWSVVNGILAPPEDKSDVFMGFIDYALSRKKAKKVYVEARADLKSIIFKALKNSKYKASMNYTLYWPVYDIQKWDEKLSGRQWKKFRNIRNRFYNHSSIRARKPRKIDKNALEAILFSWLKRRHPRDSVDSSYYLNVIDNNFRGFDMARALSINGGLCSISAGWKIPNSDGFYLGIGIFNYRHKDMGDFVNLDDFMHLKKIGCKQIDLGGSDKAILHFKMKFKPEKIYKTCVFSVSRKK